MEIGIITTSLSTVFSGIVTLIKKNKLKALNECKKVDNKNFTGFGYIEGCVSSDSPFNFTFGNTPYSLIVKQMIYSTPLLKIKEIKMDDGIRTIPVIQNYQINGILEYSSNIRIDGFRISDNFIQNYFELLPMNIVGGNYFYPSMIVDDPILQMGSINKLNGISNNSFMTIIGYFNNGTIFKSNRYNYAGNKSFNEIKSNTEVEYIVAKWASLLSASGLIIFSVIGFMEK